MATPGSANQSVSQASCQSDNQSGKQAGRQQHTVWVFFSADLATSSGESSNCQNKQCKPIIYGVLQWFWPPAPTWCKLL